MGEGSQKKYQDYSKEEFQELPVGERVRLLCGARGGMKRFHTLATPEEKEYWKQKRNTNATQQRLEKAEERKELMAVIQKNFPKIKETQAEAESTQAQWIPSQDILEAARTLYKRGMAIDDLRNRLIDAGLKTKNWPHFEKYLMRHIHANPESLGLTLVETYNDIVTKSDKVIASLEGRAKLNPKKELQYLSEIYKWQKYKTDHLMRLGEILYSNVIAPDTNKPKGITVNINIPRPNQEKDITPKDKMSTTDKISGTDEMSIDGFVDDGS